MVRTGLVGFTFVWRHGVVEWLTSRRSANLDVEPLFRLLVLGWMTIHVFSDCRVPPPVGGSYAKVLSLYQCGVKKKNDLRLKNVLHAERFGRFNIMAFENDVNTTDVFGVSREFESCLNVEKRA